MTTTPKRRRLANLIEWESAKTDRPLVILAHDISLRSKSARRGVTVRVWSALAYWGTRRIQVASEHKMDACLKGVRLIWEDDRTVKVVPLTVN